MKHLNLPLSKKLAKYFPDFDSCQSYEWKLVPVIYLDDVLEVLPNIIHHKEYIHSLLLRKYFDGYVMGYMDCVGDSSVSIKDKIHVEAAGKLLEWLHDNGYMEK